jgi:rhamnogalacturonyl hydrolase YesR
MQNTRYRHFAYGRYVKETGGKFMDRFHTAIKMDRVSPQVNDFLDPDQMVLIMQRVADWQLANPFKRISRTDWHYGAFYTGLRALYEVTEENRYKNELINIGQANNWRPMDDIFHADRLTVIDNWAWLSELEDDPAMIRASAWALDIHLARNYKKLTDVRFQENPYRLEWWTWCDALFMAPPSFALMAKITGKEAYLHYADEQWWKTSDYLYSPQDSLYFRDDRYFDQRSERGKKIFWSRGNGWVIAGLARMLNYIPEEYENRQKFVQQYQEMAHKLLSLQGNDGLWRVSLVDPEYLDIGETSGSAFFTFALAWGLNNGLIDKKYQPQVEKGWKALCGNVNREGRLGYVQQVAGDPYPFYEDQWQVYATGAYLLAGQQMIQLMGGDQ